MRTYVHRYTILIMYVLVYNSMYTFCKTMQTAQKLLILTSTGNSSTLPETNSSPPEHSPGPKRKQSYSNHPFSGAFAGSFREGNSFPWLSLDIQRFVSRIASSGLHHRNLHCSWAETSKKKSDDQRSLGKQIWGNKRCFF